MRYCWDDYAIDRDASLLTCRGQPIDASRRVLDCIAYLLAHNDRVVGHDELIRKLWGHDSVTNHQLAQVVLAARRAIGDDGHAQRLIRTVPGLGYHWVGELRTTAAPSPPLAEPPPSTDAVDRASSVPESDAVDVASGDQALASPQDDIAAAVAVPHHDATAPASGPSPIGARPASPQDARPTTEMPLDTARDDAHAIGTAASRNAPHRRRWLFVLAVATIVAGLTGYLAWSRSARTADVSEPLSSADPLLPLERAMWAGEFEKVRDGLSRLPPALANAPDARLLEIRLDYARGRIDNAMRKLAIEEARATVEGDLLWQAKLLIQRSSMSDISGGKSAGDAAQSVQAAFDLLRRIGPGAPREVLSDAHRARARVRIRIDMLADAANDLIRSRDLAASIGDQRRATIARNGLARVWMRTGRLHDALHELSVVYEAARGDGDALVEVFALNSMTRIQIELLRWDDALASNDLAMARVRDMQDFERRYRSLGLRALVLSGMGRLREADAMLEDADAMPNAQQNELLPAIVWMEAGDHRRALVKAAQCFDGMELEDNNNIVFESKDGALLIWTIAARGLVDAGHPPPVPSAAQMSPLRHPSTALARAARGYWLWSRGDLVEAESELRAALADAEAKGLRYRMRVVSDALVGVLLQRGENDAAAVVVENLRAFDPDAFDGDFGAQRIALRVALARGDANADHLLKNTRRLAGERRLSGAAEHVGFR